MREDLILWDVVEEHFDEATFLWSQRQDARRSHDYTLESLEGFIESRLLAHMDGLAVAGDPAVERLLRPALEAGDEEATPVAAFAMAACGYRQEVLGVMYEAAEDVGVQIAQGLALLPDVDRWGADVFMQAPVEPNQAVLRFAALTTLDAGPLVVEGLASPNPGVRGAALDASWASRYAIYLPQIEALVADADLRVSLRAMNASFAHGGALALEVARQHAGLDTELSHHGSLLLGLSEHPADHEILLGNLAYKNDAASALFGLGFSGRSDVARAALELLEDEALGGLALEAFMSITGLDLDADNIEMREAPEPEVPDFEEDDLDANLVPGFDELLPVVELAAVQPWWAEHARRFVDGRAYLHGRPRGEGLGAFASEPLRRHPAQALALARRTVGRRLWPSGRDARAQRRRLR